MTANARTRRADSSAEPGTEPVAEPAQSPAPTAAVAVPGLALPGEHRLARSSAVPDDPLGGTPIPDQVLSALRRRRGSGQPLPEDVREPIGAELGHDLSAVRVHADAEADRIARSVQSVAFSYGTDVYFTAGTYRPRDSGGQRLLAHELAHVAQPASQAAAAGTVGRADDPAEAAADRTAARVVSALRRRAAESSAPRAESSEPAPPGGLDRLRRQHDRVLQRVISYDPDADQLFARSRKGMLARLTKDFEGIDPGLIETKIAGIEALKAKWTPYQAYRGITVWLRDNYAPVPKVFDGDSQINPEEARYYFVSNFKTFAEVIIDDKVFKFTNVTEKDLHAEDSFMAAIDKYVEEQGWHEDFSGCHTILMRINNSPCIRCAERLYAWKYRDIFVDFNIQFANMYEKGVNFDKATTTLRSGGITMELYSVTANLAKVLSKSELAARKPKDNREAIDYAGWLKQHEPSASAGSAEKVDAEKVDAEKVDAEKMDVEED